MLDLLALQMNSQPNAAKNLDFVVDAFSQYKVKKDSLVVLPECFAYFGGRDGDMLEIAEKLNEGPIQSCLKKLSQQYKCYIVSGTFPLLCAEKGKFFAASLMFNPSGNVIAEYHKIHLFDVSVNDSTKTYQESKYTLAGKRVTTISTPIGKIGMAVCYDLRFSGLFDAMGDIDILVLPAAFTQTTGEAHWHTLLRARAIEKQCFVVAAGQVGSHLNGRQTFGHSLVVSPWGDILDENKQNLGIQGFAVDVQSRNEIKKRMPVSEHNQFHSHFVEK